MFREALPMDPAHIRPMAPLTLVRSRKHAATAWLPNTMTGLIHECRTQPRDWIGVLTMVVMKAAKTWNRGRAPTRTRGRGKQGR